MRSPDSFPAAPDSWLDAAPRLRSAGPAQLPEIPTGAEPMLPQFPQLNSKSADLHLIIIAPQELDVFVRQIAHQVAGLVKSGSLVSAEWVGKKSFRRQLRAAMVAASHAHAPNVEFAGHADWTQLKHENPERKFGY